MKSICIRTYRPKFSGYGYGLLEFIESFKRAGYDFHVEDGFNKSARPCNKDVVIHFGFPHFFRIEPGKINIGRVMLESDSLPRLWAEILNGMDEVWVASSFNVKSFVKGGVDKKKIHVIPEMAGRALGSVSPKERVRKKEKGAPFRFLSVFLDLSMRKGWDVMIESFIYAFAGRKDVEWLVQCSAGSARNLRGVLKTLRDAGLPVENIKVWGKRPSPSELRNLYRSADCYVLPTRGEGFGRPYLEAAMCGLPIISTGWSGHLDFLNKKNSRLVKYRLQKLPAPGALDCYFMVGQKWAEPSGEDLSSALLEALERPAFKPVNLEPFSEEAVMEKTAARLSSVKKGKGIVKKLRSEIIVYRNGWKEEFKTEAEFVRELRAMGKTFAIAGTGRNAGWLSEFLSGKGFEVPYYVDRKPGRFMKKKVYTPNTLPAVNPSAVLISVFPGSFAEWKAILEKKFESAVPVIFYRTLFLP